MVSYVSNLHIQNGEAGGLSHVQSQTALYVKILS